MKMAVKLISDTAHQDHPVLTSSEENLDHVIALIVLVSVVINSIHYNVELEIYCTEEMLMLL